MCNRLVSPKSEIVEDDLLRKYEMTVQPSNGLTNTLINHLFKRARVLDMP